MKTNENKPSYSAGPWEVYPIDGSTQLQVAQPETKEIGRIAEVWGRSNAKLIAAAPDLLEAAKRAVKAFEELPPRNNEDRYEPLMALSAAIARAES